MKKLLFIACLLCTGLLTYGQFFPPPTYLQGNHLEVAVGENGVYTNNFSVPPGFHPTEGSLGLVNDVNRSDWDPVGSYPAYCGDHFAPGSPVEGFSLSIDGVVSINEGVTWEISGGITSSENGPGLFRYAVWEGSEGGLDLRQTTVFFRNRQYVFTVVDICNASGGAISNIYYGRNWDPDSDQPWSGDYVTSHEIISQPPAGNAVIKSEGLTFGCSIETVSADPRARASYGSFFGGSPETMWNGSLPYTNTAGTTNTADEANQMSFNIGTLNDGDCTCLSMVSVYLDGERSDAVARLPMACSEVANLLAAPLSYDFEATMNPDHALTERRPAPSALMVYPNPATNFATVDLTAFADTEVTIRLVNVAGQTVFEQRKVVTYSTHYLGLQDFPAGLYAIQIDTGEKVKTTRLMIK